MNEKHPWEKAYETHAFSITTYEPSVLVKKYGERFVPQSLILDMGCGNGRNAMYLADKGCRVDAFDVAELDWLLTLSPHLLERIWFRKADIRAHDLGNKIYDGALLLRIIQYLSQSEVEKLIRDISRHLTPNGMLLLNYSVKGGIRNRPEINVPVYDHALVDIETLLKTYFRDVCIEKGAPVSLHTGYSEPIEAYDIAASGLVTHDAADT